MSTVLSRAEALEPAALAAARAYSAAGWALCSIEPRSKKAYGPGWQNHSRPVEHWVSHPDDGMGLIHGLSGTCSLDLDDLESASIALAAVGVDLAELLDDPAAVRMIGKPGRGKLLYCAPAELARVVLRWPDPKTGGTYTVLELRAGAVQDVLPPSVHPDTGEPYRWDGDWRSLPGLPEALLDVWQHWSEAKREMEAACPWRNSAELGGAQRESLGSRQHQGESVIAAFNAAHPDPRPFLESNGYLRAGNRWTAPTSESGLPGVVALVGDDGRTRVYSHHGSDPLNTGKALDPFDLFTHFEHGGDVRRAVRAAAELLGMTYREQEAREGARIAEALLDISIEEVREDEVGEPIPEGEGEADAPPDLTHDALALKWGDRLRRSARYVAAWNAWYFYVRSTWHQDDQLLHMTLMRRFLRGEATKVEKWAAKRLEEAEESGDKVAIANAEKAISWAEGKATALRSAQTVAQVVGLARSNPNQVAVVKQWDADPWALGTPEGVVDLRTGKLRGARPDDYVTKSCAVAPAPSGTPAPIWTGEFLPTITGGDEALQGYLRRFAGYALTGSIREHVFAFGHGTGANGKGTFLNTLKGILESYAAVIPSEMLMVSQNDRHPTELARLRGIRLAIASETEQGKRWAESKIKSLTGGDPVAARFMRADFFEFEPQFKLFVVGNHRPSIRGVDEAMRRRLHFVPFEVTIPAHQRDKDLPEKLRAEWPAILRWAIDGCLEWQERGLMPPASVQKATEEYFEDEDAVGLWLAECTTPDANAWEPSSALFGSWKAWAEAAGEFVGTQKRFAHVLEERGFQEKRTNSARGFYGARLKPATPRFSDWRDREAS